MPFSATVAVANFTAQRNVINLVNLGLVSVITAPTLPMGNNQRFAIMNHSAAGSPFTLMGNGALVQPTSSFLDIGTTGVVVLGDGGSITWQFRFVTNTWLQVPG